MSALHQFPATLAVQPERIPAMLKDGRKHVAWKWRMGDNGKPTKPPVNPNTGNLADATGPSTWATFEDALAYMLRHKLPGMGRVLTPTDDVAGIDLDHCVDPETGEIEPWALAIIAMFAPTYCEYSPSGTGIRIFVRGRLDGAGCKVGDIEVYDQGRYLTLTGHPIPGAADTVAEHQGALTTLYRQLQAERVTTPAASMEFTANLDAEGATILERLRPQEPGERLHRSALTERIWKIAHGDDAILKPTKDGLVPYEGESERRYAVVCALYDVGLNDDEVKAAFKATARWRQCVAAHGAKDAERRLTQQDMPNAKGFIKKQREEQTQHSQGTGTADADETPIDRKLNEVANAARFVRQHGDRVRYCKSLDSWFVWDGTRWQADTRGAVMELAKATAARIYREAADAPEAMRDEVAKWARRSHFRAGLTAMVALAQSDPAVAILDTDLDSDRWVLNCVNGSLDLRTGILRPHNPADLLTKRCPVTYDPDATLPLWDTFLTTTTGGKEDFADFLRRAAGATLAGENRDEVMFLPHGGGGGGKSTFLESLKGTLGEYAKTADFETFIKKRGDAGIRNDVARLAGARLVVSIEVDDGKTLAMALLKTLTGNEDTTARFLYKEATESRPSYSLWLAANDAPKVRSDDDAAWRRILRLPFTHIVPKAARDPQVKATLRDPAIAGAAILAWAMRGCLEWQRDGLGVPEIVEEATEAYRREMNPIIEWADEYCDLSPQSWTPTERLWKAYQTYAQEQGGRSNLTKKAFAEHLKTLGCIPVSGQWQGKKVRGWDGIAFKDDDTPRGDALDLDPDVPETAESGTDTPDSGTDRHGIRPTQKSQSTQGESALLAESGTDRDGLVSKVQPCLSHEGEVAYPSVPSVPSVPLSGERWDIPPEPTDAEIVWEWIVAVKAEREFGMPDAVCAAAVRLGCALDRFASAEEEAARLGDYLDRHATMKGGR